MALRQTHKSWPSIPLQERVWVRGSEGQAHLVLPLKVSSIRSVRVRLQEFKGRKRVASLVSSVIILAFSCNTEGNCTLLEFPCAALHNSTWKDAEVTSIQRSPYPVLYAPNAHPSEFVKEVFLTHVFCD